MSRLLIYALSAVPLFAQTTNWHGLRASKVQSVELVGQLVQFETWVEQLPRDYYEGVYPSFAATKESPGKATIGRLTRDHFRKVQVGYSVTLEAEPNGHGTLVTFEPLPPADDTLSALPRGWTSLPPEAMPVPQLAQNGDVIKLLLYSRPFGTKLVEYIRIGSPGLAQLRDEAPRDSYAEDAEFSISHPAFRANGRSVTSAAVEDFHSAELRARIPGFGSYVLSLKQHPGFENAGEAAGNSLTFMVRGNLFRIDCADLIASGSAGYNVYAKFDPDDENTSEATIRAEQPP